MSKDRGVLLLAWGKRGYGFFAYNLAVSIKHYSPNIPVHIIVTKEVMREVGDRSVFDHITWLEATPKDPGRFKASIYKYLPFENTLYLDVDAICLKPLEGLFEDLEKKGGHYYTYIQDVYDQNSPNVLPRMYWAYREDIWHHYNLNGHKMPAAQSSIQFIKKCEQSKVLFETMERCFDDPIPVEKLRNQWGGGQPDELYLNVAMALTGCENHIGDHSMWFGNNGAKRPSDVEKDYYLLSFFGWKMNIKADFWTFYDNKLIKMCAKRGHNHNFKNTMLRDDKIANFHSGKPVNNNEKKVQLSEITRKKRGKIHLFSSYYSPGDVERKKEIDQVWSLNTSLSSIDKIINLGKAYNHPKVINLDYERPTYAQFLNEMQNHPADYMILANADIFFTGEIESVKDIDFNKNVALALSRWDVLSGNKTKLHDYDRSQDTWVFYKTPPKVANCDFTLGLPGCDNRFAYELAQSAVQPINPSRSIKTYHLHGSKKRTYSEKDRLHGQYLHVSPEHDTKYRKKKLQLIQPGRVGDILICLPIAKWYYDKGFIVEWVCPKEYHGLFDGVDYVSPILSPSGHYDHTIDLSFGLNTSSPVHKIWLERRKSLDSFVRLKYELASVPLSELRTLDYIRNHDKELQLFLKVVHCFPFKLAHTQSSYGGSIVLDGEDVIHLKPIPGFSILDWRLVIEKASEVHCIDSSLLNFVDNLNVDAKLFYYPLHERAKDGNQTMITQNWTRVKQLADANN